MININPTGWINNFIRLFTDNWKLVMLVGAGIVIFVLYTMVKNG